MAPRIGVVVLPGDQLPSTTSPGRRGGRGRGKSCSGTVTHGSRGRSTQRRPPGGLRPRRLPAPGCPGPLARRDGGGAHLARTAPAARSSASATASRSWTEAGLLPGALQKNRAAALPSLRQPARVVVTSTASVLTSRRPPGDEARHPDQPLLNENYTCDDGDAAAPCSQGIASCLRYADNPNVSSRRHRRHIGAGAPNVVSVSYTHPRAGQSGAARIH